MDSNLVCQSCCLPIKFTGARGREKDGSRNADYCSFCYHQGAFVHPHLTVHDMKNKVRLELKNANVPDHNIEIVLLTIPHLKRWKQE